MIENINYSKKPYNIGVYLTLDPYVGGSYQYWYSILQALSGFDHDNYKIFGLCYNDEWSDITSNFGIQIIKLHKKRCNSPVYRLVERAFWKYNQDWMLRILLILSTPRADSKSMRKNKFDLILSDFTGFAKQYRLKCAIPIHDIMHRYERDIPEMIEGYEYREKMYNREVMNADFILVDSELGKKQILESYGHLKKDLKRHIEILPFIPPSYIYNETKNSSNLQLPDKFIFYPAQFWAHKNHIRLLDAVSRLRDEGIIVTLLLSGSQKNNYSAVINKIRDNELENQVQILGYISNDDIVYIYKHARALIYPTLFGPTNIPPLEAFHIGCPVATSDIYAMREQLGDAALFFDPRNTDEIANVIKRLWEDDDLCRKMISKGKEHSKNWGPNQFADKLGEIIERQKNI